MFWFCQHCPPPDVWNRRVMNPRVQAALRHRENMVSAIEKGLVDRVRHHIAMGIHVDTHIHRDHTLLHHAVAANHVSVVSALLELGARTHLPAADGRTPLQWAVARADHSIVQALLEHRADVNIIATSSPERQTILHDAATRGDIELIQLLLKYGANFNATDNRGTDILGYAAAGCLSESDYASRDRLFTFLIAQGAQVLPNGPQGESKSLNHVLRRGTMQGLQLFLNNGLQIRDLENKPLLHSAAENGQHPDVLLHLLDTGIFNIDRREDRMSALHIAVSNNVQNCASLLLQYGADPNTVNRSNQTPLYVAVANKKLDLVNLLLEFGAHIYADYCWNLFKFAVEESNGFHPQYRSETQIARALIKQMALLESRGHVVDSRDIQRTRRYPREFAYFHTCRNEIALLKGTVINRTCTFYDILTSDNAYQYLHIINVTNALRDERAIVERFPNFGEHLNRRVARLQHKLRCMHAAMDGLNRVVPFDVYAFPNVALKILNSLRIIDLKSLNIV